GEGRRPWGGWARLHYLRRGGCLAPRWVRPPGEGHGAAGVERGPALAEGRHARHLRGHGPRARGPRLRALGHPGRRPSGHVSLDGSDQRMSQVWKLAAIVLLAVGVTSCAETTMAVPPGTVEADRFLFERGQAAVKERKWVDAREYFRNIVDNYPLSPFRPDAKL